MAVNCPAFVETTADIQICGTTAQGANINVYFSESSELGFVVAFERILLPPPQAEVAPTVVTSSFFYYDESVAGHPIGCGTFSGAMDLLLSALAQVGVNVFIVSGDLGSNGGIQDRAAHVPFPSSSPWATCCGGTVIINVNQTSSGPTFDEVVWGSLSNLNGIYAISSMTWASGTVTVTSASPHQLAVGAQVTVIISGVTPNGYNGTFLATITGASTFTYPLSASPGTVTVQGAYLRGQGATGGGASTLYVTPPFQTAAGLTQITDSNNNIVFDRRFVPDVAGMVSVSGIYLNNNPLLQVIGTSLVAPLYAGLWATLQSIFGRSLGIFNATLYQLGAAIVSKDVTLGNNDPGDGSGAPYYSAGPGWDPCTGWGSIDGTQLLTAIAAIMGLGPPSVTSVFPNSGPLGGGTTVTITGNRLTGAGELDFAGVQLLQGSFTVVDDNTINVTAPPQAVSVINAGGLHVVVKTPLGASTPSPVDLFTYVPSTPGVTQVDPNNGPPAGGTTVTITGNGFTGVTGVSFNGSPATNVVPDQDNPDAQLTAVSPTGTGTVDVTVATPGGTSAPSSADQFTYIFAAPTVGGVQPNSGPQAGGTTVTVTGSGFTGVIAVGFDADDASNVAPDPNNPDTQLTADSPPGSGTVRVTVTTPGGTSSADPGGADQFTYQ
jgi:subtilase family serine protease